MPFTPNTTEALPAEGIDPAKPTAPPYGILSVAKPIPFAPSMRPTTDGLPDAAVRFRHQRCVQAATFYNCPPDSFTVDPQDDPEEDERVMAGALTGDVGYPFYPVNGYVPVGCDNIPADAPQFRQWGEWAEEDLDAAYPHLLEEFLWYKASLPSVQGAGTVMPSLCAVATIVGDPEEALNPRDGLARLVAVRNDCNFASGDTTVHVPDILGKYLADRRSIAPVGKKMQTSTGEDVILGTGYAERIGPNDLGEGEADPTPDAEGTAWMMASGPIFTTIGKTFYPADPKGVLLPAGRIPEGFIDPRTSKQLVIAQRRSYFMFDTCCVYAIKVRIPNVEAEVG